MGGVGGDSLQPMIDSRAGKAEFKRVAGLTSWQAHGNLNTQGRGGGGGAQKVRLNF